MILILLSKYLLKPKTKLLWVSDTHRSFEEEMELIVELGIFEFDNTLLNAKMRTSLSLRWFLKPNY